ncbi:MAG: PKD domain-containing protein [Bacteroidia bacterium]
MKNKTLISIFIIICSLHSFATTIIPAGNVSGNWALSGSPYLVQGHIIVPSDSTLTIAAGVIVQFQGHYKLFCNGRILAIGTISDSITFTVRPDSIANGWWGIRFDNTPSTNDSSLLVFCKIQYGNANGTNNDSKGGGIFLNNFSKLRIANTTIINNKASSEGGGIYCENNSSPLITGNTINNNSATGNDGGGIGIYNSSPTISGNTISGNTTYAAGGGICINYTCSPIITNNTISSNSATYNYAQGGGIYCGGGSSSTIIGNNIKNNSAGASGGGIYCYELNTTSLISGNAINNNSSFGSLSYQGGGGIFCNGGSHTIINNIICNNNSASFGGGICTRTSSPITNNAIVNNTAISGGGIFTSSSPNIYNCTIANNFASSVSGGGGGLYCSNGVNPILKNVIFFGNNANNGNSVYLDNVSNPSFTYCNVQGGSAAFFTNGNPYTGVYSNNINTNPLFVSPTSGSGSGYNGLGANWSLQNNSPCINSGDPNGTYSSTDLAGNTRVVCTIDIGAYENQVNLKPSVGFTINNATQCLTSNNFLFNDTSKISSGALSRNWNFGNGTIDTSSVSNPSKTYITANSYQVKLVSTSNFGCKDSLIKTVTVYPQPKSGFTVNNYSQCLIGNSFSFDDTTSTTANRLWNLGDLTTNTNDTFSKSYSSAGTYNVKLKVTDSHNCTDSVTKTITVKPNPAQPIITAITKALLQSSVANSYQWYLNNFSIPGATSQTLSLGTNGTYNVKIDSTNGCSNTSNPFTALSVGVNEINTSDGIKIYPNPNNGKFTINFNSLQGEKQIEVFDIHGKLMAQISTSKYEIEIQPENNLAKGIYLLRIQTEKGMMNTKVVVE